MTLQAGVLCQRQEAEKGAELATHISTGVSLEDDLSEGEASERTERGGELASKAGFRWVQAVSLEEESVEGEASEEVEEGAEMAEEGSVEVEASAEKEAVLNTSISTPPSISTPQMHGASPDGGSIQAEPSGGRPSQEPVTTRTSTSALSLIFEDEETLRATSVRSVLRRGAAILQNSVGTDATYALSRPVDRIDVFISHNWLVPRHKKFWALALHFNLKFALVASCGGVALGCLMNVLSVPPPLQNVDIVVRPHCEILGSLIFFLALFIGHDIPLVSKVACRQQVFLDKVCIHQTDAAKKVAGIRSLGAFLSRSDRMLVLLNSLYVQKLWTVYEMACFMYLHRPDELDLLPVDIARVTLQSTALLMTLQGLTTVFTHVGSVLGFGSAIRAGAGGFSAFVVMFPLTFVVRAWALQRSDLFLSLRSFQIEKARCADESDRPLVSLNVCSFVRAMGLADDDTNDADALQAFDRLVQERLPQQLKNAVGRTGVPYKYAVLAGTAAGFYALDTISSQPEVSASFVLAWLLWAVHMQVVVIPSAFLITGGVCNSYPRLEKKWAELAFKLGIAVLAYFGGTALYLLASFFRSKTELDLWWVGLNTVALAVEALAIAKLF